MRIQLTEARVGLRVSHRRGDILDVPYEEGLSILRANQAIYIGEPEVIEKEKIVYVDRAIETAAIDTTGKREPKKRGRKRKVKAV